MEKIEKMKNYKRTGNNQYDKVTIETIKERALKKGLFLIEGQEYKNTKTKMEFIDENGYKYYVDNDSLVSKKSKKISLLRGNKFALENLKLFIKLNNLEITILEDEYPKDCKTPMKCQCSCGNIYYTRADYIINDKPIGCIKCRSKRIVESRLASTKDLKEKLYSIGYKLLDENGRGTTIPVNVEDENGYRYKKDYDALKYIDDRPYPFYLSNPHFVHNIKNYIKSNNLKVKYIEGEYKSNKSLLTFQCSCGNLFTCTFSSFMYSNIKRCEKCQNAYSGIEFQVKEYLEENNIDYKFQYRINDCKYINTLPFDFAVFKNNKLFCLIEVQGLQHYTPVDFSYKPKESNSEQIIESFEKLKIRDNIKKKYCEDNDILFIELKYDLFPNNKYKQVLNEFGVTNQI